MPHRDEFDRSPLRPAMSWRALLGISVASAMAGVLLIVAGARWYQPSPLDGPVADAGWTSRSRGWFTARDFQPAEVRAETGGHISWSNPTSRLLVPHLNRAVGYLLSITMAADRPADAPPASVRIRVDGAVVTEMPLSNGQQIVNVPIARRAGEGAIVSIRTVPPFVRGPEDTRQLGVVISNLRLVPDTGHFRPGPWLLLWAGLTIASAVAGLFLSGLHRPALITCAATLTVAVSWLLLQDGAFMGAYVDRLRSVGVAIGLIGCAMVGARALWPAVDHWSEWPTAVGVGLWGLAIKLAFFAHPLATIGDGIFQVHRAAMVAGGQYFFTSVTGKPFFEFPYAVALYVAAMPFWPSFRTDLDRVWLLRILALGADALVGLAWYAVARRQWRDPRIALVCLVLWTFARAPFIALANANLTNAFGQAVFGLAVAALAWIAARPMTSALASLIAAGLLTIAFLSHFGTVSIGVPLTLMVAAGLLMGAAPEVRRAGVRTVLILVAALGVAWVTSYSHFTSVYQETANRVLSVEEPAAPGKIVAPPSVKLANWLTERTDDYGQPGVALFAAACIGAWLLFRRRSSEGVTRVLMAWALTWFGFSALGILSPVQMRANLSAAPMLVALGAFGVGSLWTRSRAMMWLAVALAGFAILEGLRLWFGLLGK